MVRAAAALMVLAACRAAAPAPPAVITMPGPIQLEYERAHPHAVEDASSASCTPFVPSYAITEISLERRACFGRCFSYTVTFRSNGTAEYRGAGTVPRTGNYRGTIDLHAFDEIALVAEEIGIFDAMRDEYACPVTDSPTAYLSLVRGGQRKTIRHYTPDRSGPARLRWFEQSLDRIAESIGWHQ